jgi:hypothetical protein
MNLALRQARYLTVQLMCSFNKLFYAKEQQNRIGNMTYPYPITHHLLAPRSLVFLSACHKSTAQSF